MGEINMIGDISAHELFDSLLPEEQIEVTEYMLFLKTRQRKQPARWKGNHVFPFDCFAGGLRFISNDFDEPLTDFEEYM